MWRCPVFLVAFGLLICVGLSAQTRIIPHLTRPGGGFGTQVIVENFASDTSSVELTAHSADGRVVTNRQVDLGALASVSEDSRAWFGDEAAYLTIAGSEMVSVTAAYASTSAGASPAHIRQSPDQSLRWRLFAGEWSVVFDGLAFVNLGETTTDVTLSQYDFENRLMARVVVSEGLAPGSKDLFVLGSPSSRPFEARPDVVYELTSSSELALTALRGSAPGSEPAFLWENRAVALEPREAEPFTLDQVQFWAYQIQDVALNASIDGLVDSSYDMVVIEPTRTDWSLPDDGEDRDRDFDTAAAVSRLKASPASDGLHRKLVIAYIDIGQAEDWRWYWTWDERSPDDSVAQALCDGPQFPPSHWPAYIAKCDPDQWLHNYPVYYWDPDWQNIVIQGNGLSSSPFGDYRSIIDEVIRDGFDGIYLDWVEAFEDEDIAAKAVQLGLDPAAEMVAFIQSMRDYAATRVEDFLIIQQNAASLIGEAQAIVGVIDAIAQEAIWFDGDATDEWDDPDGFDYVNDSDLVGYYLGYLSMYQQAGVPVFACEYALESANEAYSRAYASGFIPYVTRRSLGRLTTTPPPGLP